MLRYLKFAFLALLCAVPARAWFDPGYGNVSRAPDGVHVTDGSCVLNIGELQVNITNHGLIGSQFSIVSSMSDAPSGQWPSGSGIEYLFAAGLWCGGIQNGEKRVSTGQFEREIRPREGPEQTIYEARFGRRERPTAGVRREGARSFEVDADDDGDGLIDEDLLNGLDDDGDGLVDEDFAMMGNQMFSCTMYDNTLLSQEEYPDHVPMNLEIVQTAYAWEMNGVDDFVVIAYDVTNIGSATIEDFRLGLLVDCDIGPRLLAESAFDDLAGHYAGAARASDGVYEPVDVAYMYDGNTRAPVPGYFGLMFRSEDQSRHTIQSVQFYSSDRPYEYGGAPTNDAERFEDLSRTRSDTDIRPGFEADYRFLASGAGFGTLWPYRTVHLEFVLVVGDGFEGLLETCANINQVWKGAYYNLDNDPWTGQNGRESLVCVEDYGFTLDTFGLSPMAYMDEDYGDTSCVPSYAIDFLEARDLSVFPDDKHCIWINMDNCDECASRRGGPCNTSNFFLNWNCNRWWLSYDDRYDCTGIAGRESPVRWITESAPPPPDLRLWADGEKVHVFWNSDPEEERDIITDHVDFEAYQIWRADNWERPYGTSEENGPHSRLWNMIAQYDLDNESVHSIWIDETLVQDTIPLGENTGLEPVRYLPACLDDLRFAGLSDAMRSVAAYGTLAAGGLRPSVRDANGIVRPGMEPLLPWEYAPAVLDTFYWVIGWDSPPGSLLPDRPARRFYEYVDSEVHNGFLYFYAVTASDHTMIVRTNETILTGPGVNGDPAASFGVIRPGTDARAATTALTDETAVYVYPNPATAASLAEFQQMQPNGDDPTGMRVMFANLPRAHNTITIYTLDGDLIQTIQHDGINGIGETPWNLVSRNGQQVVSGIYLYVVQPDDPRFEKSVGKFVLVR
jgi:hypothetical protein